jgi:hypothetical protein
MHAGLTRKTALIAAIAAVGVAGCGGSDDGGSNASGGSTSSSTSEALSSSDYASEIQGVLTRFGEAAVSLGAAQSSAESLDELQGLTQTAVDDLNAITPPTEAEEGHRTLTAALGGYLSEIEALADTVQSDNPDDAQAAALQLQQAALDFQSEFADAAAQLQDAGIELPAE